MSIDPLADSPNNVYMSPYHFVANDPISNIDPDGLDWFRNSDGEEYWEDRSEANEGEEHLGAYHIVEGKTGYVLHHQNEVIATSSKSESTAQEASACLSDCANDHFFSNIPLASGGLQPVYPEAIFFPGPKLGIGGGVSTTLGFAAFKYGDDLFKIGSNARKMQLDEIGEFLGKGKNWHQSGAKKKFLNKFRKDLKGDTNADFWIICHA